MEPRLSLIIPTHNSVARLTNLLEQLLEHAPKSLQIVVVNDGSTDQTVDVLREFQCRFPRLVVVNQENLGLSAARNRGLAEASGIYGIFLDDDDFLDIELVFSEILVHAEADRLDVGFFDTVPFAEGGDSPSLSRVRKYYARTSAFYVRSDLRDRALVEHMVQSGGLLVSACLYVWRRHFIVANGVKFRPGVIMEDNLFTFKVLSLAEKVSFLGYSPHRRLVRADSLSQASSPFRRAIGYFDAFVGGILFLIGRNQTYFRWQAQLLMGFLKSALKNTYRGLKDLLRIVLRPRIR